MSDEPIPLLPAQAQLHNAIRWLEDTANIGNANAALIHRVLQATLLEDAKIKASTTSFAFFGSWRSSSRKDSI